MRATTACAAPPQGVNRYRQVLQLVGEPDCEIVPTWHCCRWCGRPLARGDLAVRSDIQHGMSRGPAWAHVECCPDESEIRS